jgi:Zn-dependent peptidase ImmA (M78 family)
MNKLSEFFKNENVDFTEEENIFPRPLARICNKLNIQAYLVDNLQDDESGKIMREEDKFVIYINSKHPAARSKFTIAHELGHYIRHKDLLAQTGAFLERRSNMNEEELKKEAEANDFAAQLLMPELKFIEIYNKNSGKLLEIANFFGVSLDAAYYRGLNLGLIQEV